YNLTLINYYNPPQKHKKPGFAIGNGQNEQTVRPLQREDMTKLQSFNFSSSNWKETAASGMWEYLVQLKSFAENSNNTIKQNSINSVRLIRFALGDGSIDNPYIIRNKEDMKVLSDVSK